VDLAKADRAVVAARLADLDVQRVAPQQALDQADRLVMVADQALDDAQRAEQVSREVTEQRDRQARAAAVDAYVSGSSAAAGVATLLSGDAQELTDRGVFLGVRAAGRARILQRQRVAQRRQEAATDLTRQRADDADTAVATTQVRVAELEAQRAVAAELVTTMDQRVESALAEAAAIAELDRAVAAKLVSDETALRIAAQQSAASPASARPRAVPRAARPAPPARTPGATTAPTARPTTTRPTTTRPPTSPTSAPNTAGALPGSFTPPPAPATSVVGGIRVNVSIAGPLQRLLDAGGAAGLVLGGGGYRDSAAQIELRRQHCGPTEFDIWLRPASQCSPPTARPGQSLHEQGLAVDFTCAGRLIASRFDPCFVWLAANAPGFGFMNLPAEPWHWSTTGN